MPNYLHPIWVIAKNNYKEVVRERLLYGILVAALLVTAASFFLATVSLDQNSRVLQDIGLASVHLFTVFISVFVATTSLSRDFERRTLYLLFPKPISRSQYLLGKFLGLSLLAVTALVILGGVFALGTAFADRGLLLGTLVNLCYSFLEVSFLTSLAVLFATFTAPLNAALYTLAFFIIGHSLTTIKQYVDHQPSLFLHQVFAVCYYLLPNLEKFDVRQAVLYGLPVPPSQVLWTVAYWLVYTGFVLALAIQSLRKQEV